MASKTVHRTQELVQSLQSMIEQGTYAPGDPIPSERELSRVQGVSRTTVRRAIQQLVDKGVLYRVPGSGTYVGSGPIRTARSGHASIGVLLPTLANPYFGELVTAIERECRSEGFQLLLGQTEMPGHSITPYLERYAENPAVQGVISVASGGETFPGPYEVLQRAGKPLLFVVRHPEAVNADAVATDHIGGARDLMRYLIGLGHRRIAYVGSARAHTPRHFQGYLQGLREAGLPEDPELQVMAFGDQLDQVGEAGVRMLLERQVDFTAIFAQIDFIAIGVLRALRSYGIRVPEQVSVVGFDNIPSAEHLHPPLTTVDHTVSEIGRLAVMLLQDRMTKRYDGPARQVIIQPRLVIRQSCGPSPR